MCVYMRDCNCDLIRMYEKNVLTYSNSFYPPKISRFLRGQSITNISKSLVSHNRSRLNNENHRTEKPKSFDFRLILLSFAGFYMLLLMIALS